MNAHPRPPRPSTALFQGLPRIPAIERLRGRQQWVAWDYVWKPNTSSPTGGKWSKPPVDPHTGLGASHSNPASWGTYEQALQRAQRDRLAGVGYVLTADDEIVGIDLDRCRDDATGMLAPWAAEAIGFAETYAEVSPSGQGVRILGHGKVERTVKFDPAGTEIYRDLRYLTITGRHIKNSPLEILPAPKTLALLMARVGAFQADRARANAERTTSSQAEAPTHDGTESGASSSRRAGKIGSAFGSPFFKTVNARALANLAAWVPSLFGSAAAFQSSTQGYRVSSAALGRDLEEDLSITPQGIKDWGVWDIGDPRDGRRTAIDVVVQFGKKTVVDAALWICERLGVDPRSIGYRSGTDGPRFGRAAGTGPASSTAFGEASFSPSASDVITQDDIALLFAERHEGRLRYCHDTGAWFEWTDTHWKRDNTDLAFQFARELGREATANGADRELKEVRKVTFAGGVERFARGSRPFAVTIEAWDKDPMLLGTPGGTVDLRTGELRTADPNDGITKQTAIAPADDMTCSRWLTFLEETTGGDNALIRFMQQWAGYSLTGITREHALVFVYGSGGNGKTVFLNTTSGIAGSYAVTAPMDTFTASKSDRHPTDLAMLRGARMVTSSETEEGRAWAESRIKQVTGGDPLSARFMRQDFFTYVPQFKLTIVGNHKPVLRNVDEAARRRFNLVPFTLRPAKPDRQLEDKLKEEWPGILRWMIDGCRDWLENGLLRPPSVQAATADYFDNQDLFGQWLEEECDCEPGNEFKSETTGALFESWSRFALAAGEQAGSKKSFSEAMQRRGFTPHKGAGGVRMFRGIRKRPNPFADQAAGGG